MVLMRLFQTSRRFHVEIQPQLVLLQKTLLNIEGLGRQLDPDLDLWNTAKPFLESWMLRAGRPAASCWSELRDQAPRYAKLLPELPRLLHQYLQHRAGATTGTSCWSCWPSRGAPTGCCRAWSTAASVLRWALIVMQIAGARAPVLSALLLRHNPLHSMSRLEGASMNYTLISFVVLYLLGTLAIGVWAGTRIKNTADFAIAGRSLPLVMVVTTTFATWFGAETVMGIPAKFVQGGLNAVVEDPFGAGTCLILVGLFFAAKLYKQNLLTIGDFYRQRYGRGIEVFCSRRHHPELPGLGGGADHGAGLVFSVLTDGAMSETAGMIVGTLAVLVYMVVGGIWRWPGPTSSR